MQSEENRKKHLQELHEFIREHRGNEVHFDKLYARMTEELKSKEHIAEEKRLDNYLQNLGEIKEKEAHVYKQNKEKGMSAWPEFEKFITAFEKTVLDALKSFE